jgi:hypothetical protein
VEVNREYVKRQLSNWMQRKPPTDQWNNIHKNSVYRNAAEDMKDQIVANDNKESLEREMGTMLSSLGRRLVGLNPWTQ